MRILILLVLVSLVGCKAKNKVTERKKEKLQIVQGITESEVISEDISIDKLEVSKSEIKEIEDNSIEEIEADSTGTVTVEVKKTDTGYIKTYKGVSKVKVTNTTKETKKTDTTALKSITEGNKDTVKKNESFIKIKREENNRKTDVEIRSTSTWFWLFLLIVVMFVVWLNRKRLSNLF